MGFLENAVNCHQSFIKVYKETANRIKFSRAADFLTTKRILSVVPGLTVFGFYGHFASLVLNPWKTHNYRLCGLVEATWSIPKMIYHYWDSLKTQLFIRNSLIKGIVKGSGFRKGLNFEPILMSRFWIRFKTVLERTLIYDYKIENQIKSWIYAYLFSSVIATRASLSWRWKFSLLGNPIGAGLERNRSGISLGLITTCYPKFITYAYGRVWNWQKTYLLNLLLCCTV